MVDKKTIGSVFNKEDLVELSKGTNNLLTEILSTNNSAIKKNTTFYVNSDGIFNNKTDKANMNKIISAFKEAGYSAKNAGHGSNAHSFPMKHNCTGKNDVWVCMVGGDDAGMYRDMLASYFKKRIKDATICIMRVYNSYKGRGITKSAKDINYLPKAYDDNYSKTDPTIRGNLAEWLTKHGYMYMEGSISDIIKDIKNGVFYGAIPQAIKETESTADITNKTTKTEIKVGYSQSQPFSAYLEIQYTVNYPYNHSSKPTIKTINVDFSLEAPEVVTTNTNNKKYIPPSFNNNISPWLNNTIRQNSFNLLQFIKDAEKDYTIDSTAKGVKKYYLYKVGFKAEFPSNFQKKTETVDGKSKEVTTNVLYEDNDMASYKMDLYSIGFFKGDIINAKNMSSSGKKLNDVISDVLTDTNYYSRMKYGNFRHQDIITFSKVKENASEPVFDFYEMEHLDDNKEHIVDGTIIGLDNIVYNPLQDNLNNSMFIFKGKYDILRSETTLRYYYQRYCELSKILKYGEHTLLGSDTTNTCSNSEAYINARDNYVNNYDERKSYTITVTGVPPVYINDYVRTHMYNETLDSGENGLKVASIEYIFDPDSRPVIQTKLGLGKPDKKFVIEEMRKVQSYRNKQPPLSLPSGVVYTGDENIEGLL